uniref:ORF101 protein n=1 Tax=Turritis glabra TaxID=63678 RepID=A0A5H2V437_TURGL|nr:ORF101 protein [Turritis glabra]
MKYHFSSMEPWWKREFSFCIPAISIKMASISLFQNSWLKMKHLPSCLFTQTTNTLGIYRKKKNLTIVVTTLESTQTFRPTMPKLSQLRDQDPIASTQAQTH